MSKLKKTVISRNNFEDGLEVEVSVKTKENVSDLESYIRAIKLLIENIELKHTSDENLSIHQDAMKRILFAVADNIGGEGGYDHLDLEYDDETDMPIIHDKDRIELLKTVLDKLS